MTRSFNRLLPAVTAEVAGSSPVVPAIHSKRLLGIDGIQLGVQKSHRNVSLLHPDFIVLYIRLLVSPASSTTHAIAILLGERKQAT